VNSGTLQLANNSFQTSTSSCLSGPCSSCHSISNFYHLCNPGFYIAAGTFNSVNDTLEGSEGTFQAINLNTQNMNFTNNFVSSGGLSVLSNWNDLYSTISGNSGDQGFLVENQANFNFTTFDRNVVISGTGPVLSAGDLTLYATYWANNVANTAIVRSEGLFQDSYSTFVDNFISSADQGIIFMCSVQCLGTYFGQNRGTIFGTLSTPIEFSFILSHSTTQRTAQSH